LPIESFVLRTAAYTFKREMSSSSSPPRVLIAIANGSEDIETVAPLDILRRAGCDVTLASIHESKNCVCARKTQVVADVLLSEVVNNQYDALVLPGGMPGATNLHANEQLKQMFLEQRKSNRWIAAICASPAVVLHGWGLLPKNATAHPSFVSKLPEGTQKTSDRVVVDEETKTITSRGPGTAIEFGLKIAEVLCGKSKVEEVANPLVAHLP